MYAFNYVKPGSLSEASALLAREEGARPLSGGMTLIPTLKQRLSQPSHLLDIAGLAELRGIAREGDAVVIGAATRHVEVATSALVREAIPALAALAAGIGDPQVRNRGTMGGSVANNDPAADYPAAVLGLGATVHTDRRAIAADDFFQGLFTTALEPGELITRTSFPLARRAAYAKFRHPASGYAMTGVFIAQTAAGLRVAVTGAGPGVFRWTDAEAALSARFESSAVASLAVDAGELNADIHAPAEYRANLMRVMAARAVEAILKGQA
jgi:carbon-monoxide dehydrogenase medium subunit